MTACAVGYTPAPGKGHGIQLLLPAVMAENFPAINTWKNGAKMWFIKKNSSGFSLAYLDALEVPDEKE